MQTPDFVVRLADLDRGPKTVTFTLSEAWLSRVLGDVGAVPLEPGVAELSLQKAGEAVMVRGTARVKITVPCVVTLDPVPLDLEPEIFLQLRQEPDIQERPKAGAKSPAKSPAKAPPGAIAAKGGMKERSARAARRLKDDPELTAEEAAYDTFRGEVIVLDEFLREFIVLEIPPYPRRSDLPSPEESLSSRPLEGPPEEAKPIDPRLLPLQGLANRLRGAANKE